MRVEIAATLLLLAPTAAVAQTREDAQLWMNFSVQGELTDELVWLAEFQPRFGDNLSRNTVLLGRIAAGWKFNDHLTIYQGLVRQNLYDNGPGRRSENRSFQQVNWKAAAGRWGSLQSRTRFEQRWFSNGSDVGLRLREQLRYEKPLGSGDDGLVGVATAEAMFNLRATDYGARRGFETARLFAGGRLPISDRHSIEAGYQMQVAVANPGTDVAHVLLVIMIIRP